MKEKVYIVKIKGARKVQQASLIAYGADTKVFEATERVSCGSGRVSYLYEAGKEIKIKGR